MNKNEEEQFLRDYQQATTGCCSGLAKLYVAIYLLLFVAGVCLISLCIAWVFGWF
jgi:hypothetical protein